MEVSDFKTGIYQHFKGMKYIALGLARHSETLEWQVVYIPLYENENAKMWVRPFDMFVEDVEHEGKTQPRFTFISTI
jgi:hypothetical protein